MSSNFSPHNPTAHLQKSSNHEHHGCSCGDGPKMSVPDPTPLDELITIHNLSVDPETLKVSLISKYSKAKQSEQKLVEDSLAMVNAFTQYLSSTPFPHCPSAPTLVQKDSTSSQISSLKEEALAAVKANNYEKAIEIYSRAAEMASNRPLYEPSTSMRDELCSILCDRSSAYFSAKMWIEAFCDAQAVIQMKKDSSEGHFRRAKALKGLGRIDDAKDAALTGLEFEPHNHELRAVLTELSK